MANEGTRVVFLGTGTPNAEPDRAGTSMAVIANNRAYLVDFGPGVVRRAQAASAAGVTALTPPRIQHAFLTHLHSDHTAGYADLILTPWTLGREHPLQVYGPVGTGAMTDGILAAYAADIRERLDGLEPCTQQGWQVDVREVEPGPVYADENVSVSTFAVRHGSWPALGYRFTAPDRTIVFSGDTAPFDALIESYANCDILVHEVYSEAGFQRRPATWQRYHAQVHTSTRQLAAIAAQVRPKLLVLVHQLYWGSSDEALLAEIREGYDGAVVSAKDLDVL